MIYVAGVETYKNIEYHVWSWSSALSYKSIGDVYDKMFLTAVIDECRLVPVRTYAAVVAFIKWCILAMMSGIWPALDHLSEPFPEGSHRARRAGIQLAGGWRAIFTSWLGDSKVGRKVGDHS